MRIPSQLNRDSLYRAKNQRGQAVENYRRVFRLCLGLALVLLVMKEAAKPGLYQVFFDPSNSPQIANPKSQPVANALKSDVIYRRHSILLDIESLSTLSPSDQKIANQLAETLLQSDQQLWLKSLIEWQSGKDNASIPSSVESLREKLANIASKRTGGLEENQLQLWFEAIDTLPKRIFDQASPESHVDLRRIALLAALDQKATSRVVDGSVWRSGDFDSLYSFLYQSPLAPRGGLPSLGVLPLLQQPEVYRNQWVRVSGSIARVDRIETQRNLYHIDEYWQIWLRPLDGINRPTVAIVQKIPLVVAELEEGCSIEEGPELVISGRYLKRLSYQSGIGADLAPVIVGEIRSAPLDASTATALTTESAPSKLPVLWLSLFAIFLGLAASIAIMWNTELAAKKSRKLRQKQQQKTIPNLSLLKTSPDNTEQQESGRDSDE